MGLHQATGGMDFDDAVAVSEGRVELDFAVCGKVIFDAVILQKGFVEVDGLFGLGEEVRAAKQKNDTNSENSHCCLALI